MYDILGLDHLAHITYVHLTYSRLLFPSQLLLFFFFLMIRRPPSSPLFPSPTLFRSASPAATVGVQTPQGVARGWLHIDGRCGLAHLLRCAGSASRRSADGKPRLMLCQSVSRVRSEEHTSELQSLTNLVCRLLLEKKK